MSSKFLKITLCFTLLFQLAGLMVPHFVSKAYALYWEDDSDLSDPKERVNRPTGFFLFDWINDLDRDNKENGYKGLENQDHGPSVNNGKKGLIIVTSAVVGLGAGLVTAYGLTNDPSQQTENLFIGGALGLCLGVAVGALIMPTDYEFKETSIPEVKYRMAWAQDPVALKTRQAFHPTVSVVSLKF